MYFKCMMVLCQFFLDFLILSVGFNVLDVIFGLDFSGLDNTRVDGRWIIS